MPGFMGGGFRPPGMPPHLRLPPPGPLPGPLQPPKRPGKAPLVPDVKTCHLSVVSACRSGLGAYKSLQGDLCYKFAPTGDTQMHISNVC